MSMPVSRETAQTIVRNHREALGIRLDGTNNRATFERVRNARNAADTVPGLKDALSIEGSCATVVHRHIVTPDPQDPDRLDEALSALRIAREDTAAILASLPTADELAAAATRRLELGPQA